MSDNTCFLCNDREDKFNCQITGKTICQLCCDRMHLSLFTYEWNNFFKNNVPAYTEYDSTYLHPKFYQNLIFQFCDDCDGMIRKCSDSDNIHKNILPIENDFEFKNNFLILKERMKDGPQEDSSYFPLRVKEKLFENRAKDNQLYIDIYSWRNSFVFSNRFESSLTNIYKKYKLINDIEDKNANDYFELGKILFSMENYQEALEAFSTAKYREVLDSNYLDEYLIKNSLKWIGLSNHVLGNNNEAEQNYLGVLELDENLYDIYVLLGLLYVDSSKKAIEVFEKALKNINLESYEINSSQQLFPTKVIVKLSYLGAIVSLAESNQYKALIAWAEDYINFVEQYILPHEFKELKYNPRNLDLKSYISNPQLFPLNDSISKELALIFKWISISYINLSDIGMAYNAIERAHILDKNNEFVREMYNDVHTLLEKYQREAREELREEAERSAKEYELKLQMKINNQKEDLNGFYIKEIFSRLSSQKNELRDLKNLGKKISDNVETAATTIEKNNRGIKEIDRKSDIILDNTNEILSIVKNLNTKIDSLRKDYLEKIKIDPDNKDKYEKKYSDAVTEQAVDTSELVEVKYNISTSDIESKYSSKKYFGDSWDLFDDDSKKYIITADIVYSYLEKLGNDVDFSSACIPLTKALEKELDRYIYSPLNVYCRHKYDKRFYEWPRALVERDNRSNKMRQLSYFSLKVVTNIFNKRDDREVFKEISNQIFKRSTLDIDRNMIDFSQSCDYIRDTFRNPSAHQDGISKDLAEDCRKYMLFEDKFLIDFIDKIKPDVNLIKLTFALGNIALNRLKESRSKNKKKR